MPGTDAASQSVETQPAARLVLKKNQDRRVRGGHPWIFSNEVSGVDGEASDGGLVEVADSRGAYLGVAYYNRHSLICARMLSRGRDVVDEEFFVHRFERAKALRARTYPDAEALRLVYGEADQLPGLIVDKYGDYLSVQVMTLGMEVRSHPIHAALQRVFKPKGIVRACDVRLRELEGLGLERNVWSGDVPERIELDVEGFAVEVNPIAGQKTGLFLDQRENRRRAERHAEGRRALDLFAYQGEWGLHMLRGGATSVYAVDSSQHAIAAAGRNFERNGFGEKVTLRQGDAFDVTRELQKTRERFGMIVIDPPALVKSRKTIARGARMYRAINEIAMTMLTDDGILISCSCSHHLDDTMFRQVLLEAARSARRPMRILDWAGAALDHPQLLAVPETHYLKCAVLQAV